MIGVRQWGQVAVGHQVTAVTGWQERERESEREREREREREGERELSQ